MTETIVSPALSSTQGTTRPVPAIAMGERGVKLESFEDAYRFADAVVKAGLAPRGLETAAKVLIALQTGLEAGLRPMQAVRSIVAINGFPSWRGDAALGILQASGLLSSCVVKRSGNAFDDDYTVTVTLVRRDMAGPKQEFSRGFSVADAKRAGLWNKRGRDNQPTPWVTFPDRMLYYRALGFACRDGFSDVLMGLHLAEELEGSDVAFAGTDAIDISPRADEPDPFAAKLIAAPVSAPSAAVMPTEPPKRRGRPPKVRPPAGTVAISSPAAPPDPAPVSNPQPRELLDCAGCPKAIEPEHVIAFSDEGKMYHEACLPSAENASDLARLELLDSINQHAKMSGQPLFAARGWITRTLESGFGPIEGLRGERLEAALREVKVLTVPRL